MPEMLIAARAMQRGLSVLKPLLIEGEFQPVGKVVAGTVKGDLHDIGKNLVCMMLEGAGLVITDSGVDVARGVRGCCAGARAKHSSHVGLAHHNHARHGTVHNSTDVCCDHA